MTSALGAACSPQTGCATGMLCMPMPGGYCTAPCGVTGSACDGACVEHPRAGELCMAKCTTDADCRTDEGYACDPLRKACMMPNSGTILPKACPGLAGYGRNPAFAPSVALSTSQAAGRYQFEPSAVVTDDGGLVALYITGARITDGNTLGLARVDAIGRASPDLPFATGKPSNFDPWLARGANGTLYATWLGFEGRGERQEIGLARSTDRGVTWSPPLAVHEPADCPPGERDCLDKPMVITGPDPRLRTKELVYVAYAAHGLRVRASRDGGRTFGPAATALAGVYGNWVTGEDGTLHIVTLNGGLHGAYGSADHAIEYTASTDGAATFAKPARVSRYDEMLPFLFSNPSIALDDRRGWLYIAYTRGGRDAKWDLVIAASKDRGKTWKRTRIGDDPPCSIHMVPNLALDPTTGSLHVAWYDHRGERPRFAHAICTPGAAKCAQQGRIDDQPFAALSTVRHAAKWIGEYQTLAIDDKRRTLHAVWTQTVDEAGQIVARVFHAKAKLR
ncbi:MAG: sialidase family protein [Kofleriaceae bacterium]